MEIVSRLSACGLVICRTITKIAADWRPSSKSGAEDPRSLDFFRIRLAIQIILTFHLHQLLQFNMKRSSEAFESEANSEKQARRQEPVSCFWCRKKKLKCDRCHPCSNCRARKLACSFSSGPGKDSNIHGVSLNLY